MKKRGIFMESIDEKLLLYGNDILSSDMPKKEKQFVQHGNRSCYLHSLDVAKMSLKIAEKLPFELDERALVRGALLHDYFLYDWHDNDPEHRLHGFTHAKKALENASRDFVLSEVERDIIKKHMFPLNITPPKYCESWVVSLADKICALRESVKRGR